MGIRVVTHTINLRGPAGYNPDLTIKTECEKKLKELGPGTKFVTVLPTLAYYDGDCPRQYRIAAAIAIFQTD